jgi:hypothetical protein
VTHISKLIRDNHEKLSCLKSRPRWTIYELVQGIQYYSLANTHTKFSDASSSGSQVIALTSCIKIYLESTSQLPTYELVQGIQGTNTCTKVSDASSSDSHVIINKMHENAKLTPVTLKVGQGHPHTNSQVFMG